MTSDVQPAERNRFRERLVRVATVTNLVDAALIQDRLQQAGIPCVLETPGLVPVYHGAVWPARQEIAVLEGDAEAATALLAAAERPLSSRRRLPGRPHR